MYDYGMSISSGEFEIHDEWAAVPSDLVFAYLLAIVTCAKAKTVYLAGLDGYDSDLRNQPIEDILREYLRLSNRPVLKTLTPTKYKLKSEPLFFA
jgi:4-hydroxy 2-oxovalerate aldolase